MPWYDNETVKEISPFDLEEAEDASSFAADTISEVSAAISQDEMDAREILLGAGMDPDIVRDPNILTPGTLALVARAPQLAQAFAEKYPSESRSSYTEIDANVFAASETGLDAYSNAADDGRTITKGGVEYRKKKNGVIIVTDFAARTERAIAPDDPDGTVPGSISWVRKVQKKWDGKTVRKWRDTLEDLGYAPEGDGFDGDMKKGLLAYYEDKWLGNLPNSGKGESLKKQAKEAFDPVMRRQAVRTAFNAVAQDDPTDEEMEPFLRVIDEEVRRALKRGAEPAHAQAKAEESLSEAIVEDPQLKWLQSRADAKTDMRDAFTAFAQALSAF